MKVWGLVLGLIGVVVSQRAEGETWTVYFGTSQSQGIYVSSFDTATGALTPPRLAIEIERPGFVVMHPDGKHLYATSSGPVKGPDGGVAALKIRDDGTLSLINKQSSGGRGPCHVSLDRSGRCLMVANYGGGTVASYSINDDGSITDMVSRHAHAGSGADPRRQQGPHPHSIFPDHDGTFAYVPDLGIDEVVIYALDVARGTLTPAGSATVPGGGMGPRHMKWSRDGAHAYVVNELVLSVSLFKPAAEPGMLSFVTTIPTLPENVDTDGMSCAEIRIHPNGRFAYASNRDGKGEARDSISLFRTAADDGTFQRLDVVPAEVSVPRNFNLDPTGRWMLVGGQRSRDIAIFAVDPETGTLSFTGRKVPLDGGPICIEWAAASD